MPDWLKVMEYTRSDMVLLAVTAIAVVTFLLYVLFGQRCRRLAKDWENLNRKALAFLRLASIRLMLRKLCNPA